MDVQSTIHAYPLPPRTQKIVNFVHSTGVKLPPDVTYWTSRREPRATNSLGFCVGSISAHIRIRKLRLALRTRRLLSADREIEDDRDRSSPRRGCGLHVEIAFLRLCRTIIPPSMDTHSAILRNYRTQLNRVSYCFVCLLSEINRTDFN